MFIYTPELFDVRRIEQAVAANGEEQTYQRLLANSSWILAGTLGCLLHRQLLPEPLFHVLRHAPA